MIASLVLPSAAMDDLTLRSRVTLAVLACLALCYVCAPRSAHAARTEGFVAGDYCDPDDRGRDWTPEQKQRTRDRVWAACQSVGGSDTYCSFHLAAVVRESWGGVASAVHRLGRDIDGDREYGLGPMGLSTKWHADKWPGDDEDPAFCTPEASFIVAHAIARRAVTVYGASNAIELQAVYGGGRGVTQCIIDGTPAWVFDAPVLGWLARTFGARPESRRCRVIPRRRHVDAVCKRMGDVACRRPLTIDDLGDPVPMAERRAWALAQARG